MSKIFDIAAMSNCKIEVGGFTLQPLSCWHVYVLNSLSSPFIAGGARTVADIITLLLVCQSRFEDELVLLHRFKNSRFYRFFFALRLIGKDKEKLSDECDAYIRAFAKSPQFWTDGNAKYSRVQFAFNIVATLLRNGVPYLTAWNMPFVMASCFFAAFAEANGSEIADDDVEKAEKAIREMEAALNKEGK